MRHSNNPGNTLFTRRQLLELTGLAASLAACSTPNVPTQAPKTAKVEEWDFLKIDITQKLVDPVKIVDVFPSLGPGNFYGLSVDEISQIQSSVSRQDLSRAAQSVGARGESSVSNPFIHTYGAPLDRENAQNLSSFWKKAHAFLSASVPISFPPIEIVVVGNRNFENVQIVDRKGMVVQSYYEVFGAYVAFSGGKNAEIITSGRQGIGGKLIPYLNTQGSDLVAWTSVLGAGPTAAVSALIEPLRTATIEKTVQYNKINPISANALDMVFILSIVESVKDAFYKAVGMPQDVIKFVDEKNAALVRAPDVNLYEKAKDWLAKNSLEKQCALYFNDPALYHSAIIA